MQQARKLQLYKQLEQKNSPFAEETNVEKNEDLMLNHIQKSDAPSDPATTNAVETQAIARFDVDSFRRAIIELKSNPQAQTILMKMFTNNNEPASKV